MPTYIGLFKWTEQDVRNPKDTLARTEQDRAAIEKAGGRLIGIWCTQGPTTLSPSASSRMTRRPARSRSRLRWLAVFTRRQCEASHKEMQRILQKLP